MNKYDTIFESLQEKVNSGELAIDDAERINQLAYEKYVTNPIYQESVAKEESDIFYNKVKYENGDINILFITGYSGGGKSTFSNSEKKFRREVIDMDRVILKTNGTDEYFRNMGSLVNAFMNGGPGKKFRENKSDEEMTGKNISDKFRSEISKSMVKFAKQFAKVNKKTKFVLEGVWIYRYIEPQEIDDCAVYIKGTSLKTSTQRAINRDVSNFKKDGSYSKSKEIAHKIVKSFMAAKDILNHHMEKFQKYFGPKYEKQKSESVSHVKKIKNGAKNITHDYAYKIMKATESTEAETSFEDDLIQFLESCGGNIE